MVRFFELCFLHVQAHQNANFFGLPIFKLVDLVG